MHRDGASGMPRPTRGNRICGFELARAVLEAAIWHSENPGDSHATAPQRVQSLGRRKADLRAS